MIRARAVLPAALVFMFGGYASADDLTDAAQSLCDMVKSCAMEQVAEQNLTPEMREMMAPMLDNMCANMRSQVQQVPVGHGLYEPAVECMRSMESFTCEQLQEPDQLSTPECAEYERLARETTAEQ